MVLSNTRILSPWTVLDMYWQLLIPKVPYGLNDTIISSRTYYSPIDYIRTLLPDLDRGPTCYGLLE